MDAELLTAVGMLITAIAGFMTGKKKASPRIEDTPAEKLWDVSEAFRETLGADVKNLREEVNELRRQLMESNAARLKAEEEVFGLRLEIARLQTEISLLRNRYGNT